MAINRLFSISVAVILGLASASFAAAQQQQSQDPAAKKPAAAVEQKANIVSPKPKPAKVWTDADLQSLRSPADVYAEQQQAEAEAAAAKAASAANAKQTASATPAQRAAWQRVWHIKTPADAQRAIDWDNRDIAAQTQYVERLRQQIDTAQTSAERDHLQQTLNDELQVIASTTRERDGIQQQKEQLEKKPAAGGSTSPQPPSL